MATMKTETKVIVGFAHCVNELATRYKTVSRNSKPQEVRSFVATVEGKRIKRQIV